MLILVCTERFDELAKYTEWREANNLIERRPRPKTNEGIYNSTMDHSRDLIGNRICHELVKYDPNNPKKQVRCHYCQTKTTFVCRTCIPTNTGFCKLQTTGRNCFRVFHQTIFPNHSIVQFKIYKSDHINLYFECMMINAIGLHLIHSYDDILIEKY